MHISGSNADGLDMIGSDVMMLFANAYANNGENATEDLSYRFNSLMTDTYPGYILVECLIHGIVAGDLASGNLKITCLNHYFIPNQMCQCIPMYLR